MIVVVISLRRTSLVFDLRLRWVPELVGVPIEVGEESGEESFDNISPEQIGVGCILCYSAMTKRLEEGRSPISFGCNML